MYTRKTESIKKIEANQRERERENIRVDNDRNLWLEVTAPFYPLMVELARKVYKCNVYVSSEYTESRALSLQSDFNNPVPM